MTEKEIDQKVQYLRDDQALVIRQIHQIYEVLGVTIPMDKAEFWGKLDNVINNLSEHSVKSMKAVSEELSTLRSAWKSLDQEINKWNLSKEQGDLPKKVEIVVKKPLNILAQCIDKGEPVFILRAQDNFSVPMLKEYKAKVQGPIAGDYTPSLEFLEQIELAIDKMAQWRYDNPEQCKYPD